MRFILLSFAFLAWGFYELSGGASYERQTEMRPLFAPVVARAQNEVTDLNLAAISDSAPGNEQIASEANAIVPVSADLDDPAIEKPVTLAALSSLGVEPAKARVVIEAPEVQPTEEVASVDMRLITGSRVNMRNGPGTTFSVVSKLAQNSRVAIVDDAGNGWLQIRVLETGNEGFVADWLVSTAQN